MMDTHGKREKCRFQCERISDSEVKIGLVKQYIHKM